MGLPLGRYFIFYIVRCSSWPGCHDPIKTRVLKCRNRGPMDKVKSRKEPESLIQMLDAKCKERFERIESLIANMARSVAKHKDREHDSSEDESHDAASGRGHSAAKRAKANTNQEVDMDTDMDDQSDGEIVDDSETLLDEQDRDLHDQEVTARQRPP